MAAVDHRAESSIHNIRESTQEHRATKSELAQTRQDLYDAKAEMEKWRQLHGQLENRYAVQGAELGKVHTSLDAVLKELNAKKSTLDSLTNANSRLKRDMERTSASHLSFDRSSGGRQSSALRSPVSNSPSRVATASQQWRAESIRAQQERENGSRAITPSAVTQLDHSALESAAAAGSPSSHIEDAVEYEGDPFNIHAPLPLYIRRCFESEVEPHPAVQKALYGGGQLFCGTDECPIAYRQLSCLIDVFQVRDSLAAHELAHWPDFRQVSVCCEQTNSVTGGTNSQEGYAILPELLERLPNLKYLRIVGLEDTPAAAVAGAIAVATRLEELELPLLRVHDEGFQHIMKVVANRDAAATLKASPLHVSTTTTSPPLGGESPTRGASVIDTAATNGAQHQQQHTTTTTAVSNINNNLGTAIRITDLDLSQAVLTQGRSFELIRGPSIGSLSFEGMVGLQDKYLGEVISSCPNLSTLNISGCTSLTKDVIMFINLGKNIKTLKMTGCVAIHNVRLYYVEELHSDLRCVTHFDAPELKRLPVPLATFNVVSFEAPQLVNITIQGTILTRREFAILSDCTTLEEVNFINCRMTNLDAYLRRARQLHTLGIHSCKGVVDSDVAVLCGTIMNLDLTDCFCVTDKVLKSIGHSLRANLTRLTLKRCSSITDGGLSYLYSLPKLEYINLMGMRRVSNEGIARLCQHVPALQHVVHETFTTGEFQVDRGDEEEVALDRISVDERRILSHRTNIALSYIAASSPSASPRTPRRPGGVSGNDSSFMMRPGSSRFGGTIGSIDDGVPNGWKSPARMSRPATSSSPTKPTTDPIPTTADGNVVEGGEPSSVAVAAGGEEGGGVSDTQQQPITTSASNVLSSALADSSAIAPL